jgi:hypothetical protein
MKEKLGQVFFPVSPDYTSMVLALGMAQSAYTTNFAGIVHVNTDISNGNKISLNDDQALNFINSFDNSRELLLQLPIPGLYSSITNLVLHDYLSMTKKLNSFTPSDTSHWNRWILEDLTNPERTWSSHDLRVQHFDLLKNYLDQPDLCNDKDSIIGPDPSWSLRSSVYRKLPTWMKFRIHRTLRDPRNLALRSIEEILKTADPRSK